MRVLLFFLLSCQVLFSQNNVLQLKEIMKGERFTGFSPEQIRWTDDGKKIFFSWNPELKKIRETYVYDLELKKIKKADSSDVNQWPQSGSVSTDQKWKVFERNGDLYVRSLVDFQINQLTHTVQMERNPEFLFQRNAFYFQIDQNLFIWDLDLGKVQQCTDFRKGEVPTTKKLNAQETWLEQDNLFLFQVLRDRKEKEELNKQKHSFLKTKYPLTIYLGEFELDEASMSPDGKAVYFRTVKRAKNKASFFMDYLASSGYAQAVEAREKVGSMEDKYKMGVYHIEKDTFFYFDWTGLEALFDKPNYMKDYNPKDSVYVDKYKNARDLIVHNPVFSKNGQRCILELKSFDSKDRWLLAVEQHSKQWKLMDRQHDEAWIGGPGIEGWKESAGNIFWIDSVRFMYHSEQSGFSQLYIADVKLGEKRRWSQGNGEIHNAWLSKGENQVYFISSEEDPGTRHLFLANLEGAEKRKISSETGNHEVYLSPDETWLATRFSSSNKPWELYLKRVNDPQLPLQITDSRLPAFSAYSWKKPSLVYFNSQVDQKPIRARLYEPERSKKNGAAVIFVHGAGYLQNAHHWWSNYFREYMFHHLLNELGYTVLDIDFRASAGYGRDWRTGIYRHMGGLDLSDQLAGVQYLIESKKIDPKRIGIYGGSYGGFITLMALFKHSDVFACGAALRSVTDWAHYNHPYTFNILNSSVLDSIAYKKSSPIYFAEGLKSKLLILHGIVDDNVQYQDVVRLCQKLIELGKENWEMATYPVEAHGFVESDSWYDEYRRILELFENQIGNKRKK